MPRRTLLIPLFIFGLFILILVCLVLWPYIPEGVDPVRIILPLIVLPLILLSTYYLRTHGTPKSDKVVATIGIGVVLGFGIFVIISLIYEFSIGSIPQGVTFFVMFFGSYVIAFVIGAYVSKKRL